MTHAEPVRVTYTRRKAPCSDCGRAVVRVRSYRDAFGLKSGALVGDVLRHAERTQVLGDKVDEACTWPT